MPAVAFASDARVQGGAMGSAGCAAIVAAYDAAVAQGAPVIGLWHSGGARLREGVESLHAVGTRLRRDDPGLRRGAADLGGARRGGRRRRLRAGADRHRDHGSDHGRIFVTGPDVVRSVTGEDVDMARLGGPEPHGRRSGVVHLVATTDADALSRARDLALLLGRRGDGPGPGDRRGTWPGPGHAAARVGAPGLRRAPAGGRAARRAGHRTARAVGAERGHHPRPGWPAARSA